MGHELALARKKKKTHRQYKKAAQNTNINDINSQQRLKQQQKKTQKKTKF